MPKFDVIVYETDVYRYTIQAATEAGAGQEALRLHGSDLRNEDDTFVELGTIEPCDDDEAEPDNQVS